MNNNRLAVYCKSWVNEYACHNRPWRLVSLAGSFRYWEPRSFWEDENEHCKPIPRTGHDCVNAYDDLRPVGANRPRQHRRNGKGSEWRGRPGRKSSGGEYRDEQQTRLSV